VSELCDAPCRAECQRGKGDEAIQYFVGDEAVDVRAVEAAVVRFAKDKKPEVFRIQPKEQSVAVVGAGLAGLSLALNLAQKAYPVTVFERGERAFSTWAAHPKYESFLEEIRLQFSVVAVDFVYSREIEGPDDPLLAGFACVHDATTNAGMDAIAAIAQGVETAKDIEAFLQTGRHQDKETGMRAYAGRPEKHYIDHKGEPGKSIVIPADPEAGYTKDEAMAESSRCMGCDCRACMDACEMLGRYNKRPQKIAVEAYSDTKSAPPFSTCSLTRETYSCNLCGYCESVCPVDVDIEKLFHLARAGRAETGKHPKAFHDFWLRDFEWHRTEGAYCSGGTERYMFFPGCKAGARSPSQIRDAAAFLKERYGSGVLLDCCGAPAYWAGEDALFNRHLLELRAKWLAAGKPVFVFACAYCMRLFGEFLPEIDTVSLYELLADFRENGGGFTSPEFTVSPTPPQTFAVFDPCASRYFPEMEKAVRKLAADLGAELTELPEKNHCCGFGGHMRVANPELYDTIVSNRIAAGEEPYLVYCANCAETFSLSGKRHAHILDFIFPVNDDIGRRGPGSLQTWRDNAVRTKAALAGLYGDKAEPPAEKPWEALRVDIPALLAADMDRRLIPADDVREAIYKAELAGEVFLRSGGAPNGCVLHQCRLIRDVVTTWVQYTVTDQVSGPDDSAPDAAQYRAKCYTIVDAWNHRMRYSDTE